MKLLYNAKIYTPGAVQPKVSVLAVESGYIVAAGGDELLPEFSDAEHEDMGGQTILPGLTDAHIHLQNYALSLQTVNCELESVESILSRLSEHLQDLHPGEWVRGHGWNQNIWGGEWPDTARLDAISPHNPVYLTAKSLHVSWANSLAMKLAGITASTPDPENGSFQRDKRGNPTGILFENAVRLVEKVIPEPEPEKLAESFQQIIPRLWSMGLTGVHDFDRRTCFLALQELHARGDLHLRVLKSIPSESLSWAVELGLRSGFGNDFLRIGSVKLFSDGALGPRTAAMMEPYIDDPMNRGILILDSDRIFETGCKAARSGISLAVHAIGDRAVHAVLDGFKRLRQYEKVNNIPSLRHRIEHVQTILPEDAGRLAELGIIASMQPIHATSDMQMAERYLGERSQYSYAWRTQLKNGAHLAFGSDAPVESPDPFYGLHAAVTRCRTDGSPGRQGWHPEQRLSLQEALAGFTSGPAYAAGMDDRLGKLLPGFLADLTVIDTDPFECDPAELYTIHPVATMVAGEWVWHA
jgi:predicted amidohydrolase YtcJ